METRARSRAALAGPSKALQEEPQTVLRSNSNDKAVYTLKYELGLPNRACSSILNDISQGVNWSENTGESSGEDSSGRTARREALASALADRLYGEYISDTELEERISFERWNEELDEIIWRFFIGGTVNWFTSGHQSQLQRLTIRTKDNCLPQNPSTAHSPTSVVPMKRTTEQSHVVLGEEIRDSPPRLRPRRAQRYRDPDTPSASPPPAFEAPHKESSGRTARQPARKTTNNQNHRTNSRSSSVELVEDKYAKIIERLCIHIDIRTVRREISCYLWLGFVPNINQFLLRVKRTSNLAFEYVDVVKVQILNSNDPEQWLDVDPRSRGFAKTKTIVGSEVPDFRDLLVENLIRRPGKVYDGKMNIMVNIE
ncbi:hypothetical protein BGX38DRAFT_1271606 [Terfezia claveryi]|nr:hypothetical protein BGX38DRAFT_1271606 [Terfezia claveryi]